MYFIDTLLATYDSIETNRRIYLRETGNKRYCEFHIFVVSSKWVANIESWHEEEEKCTTQEIILHLGGGITIIHDERKMSLGTWLVHLRKQRVANTESKVFNKLSEKKCKNFPVQIFNEIEIVI